MRTFLGTYWKVIAALIILIVLAAITMSSGEASPTLAARLRAHVREIDASQTTPEAVARHIEAALAGDGYRVRHRAWPTGAHTRRAIEATLANLAPGARAARVFIVGASGAHASGAAAVLELARLLRNVQPAPGTELTFVFFVDPEPVSPSGAWRARDGPDQQRQRHHVDDPGSRYPETGNFVAFIGSPAASRQVQQALSPFRPASDFPAEGLAAPALAQGVTLSNRAPCKRCGQRTLTVSDSAFLGYPYFHTAGDAGEQFDYDSIARVVNALSRTISTLAGGRRG
jgi:hypothetical protein